jgi:hypothetical protein
MITGSQRRMVTSLDVVRTNIYINHHALSAGYLLNDIEVLEFIVTLIFFFLINLKLTFMRDNTLNLIQLL